MDRILILGCSGAGKSTLAGQLSEILDLPLIHLDQEFWQPGWVQMTDDEWFARVEALIQGERWIMDGNYGSTLEMRLKRADAIIFLDYPRWRCLWGVAKRVRRHRGRTRPDTGPGCAERWDWEFIRFIWEFRKKGRIRNYRVIGEMGMTEKTVVLKGPKETRGFVQKVRDERRLIR